MQIFFLPFIFLILTTQSVHAGAAVAKQQQMKAMKQQAYQQAVQQAMAEKQAAEVQAYQQAVAQYQAQQAQVAQYQAAAQYMGQYRQMVAQAIAQRMQAQQMDQMQMQMVQQVVQQQLVQRVAAQMQANQKAQVENAMISQAIQEAVVKLGMQAYINDQAQQRMAAQAVLATRQAAATGQMQQAQSANNFVQDPQIQQRISKKVQQFLSHTQTNVTSDVLCQTVSNVLARQIAQRMSQGGGVDVSPEMIDLAINEAANLLGIQSVYSAPSPQTGYEPALGNDVVDIVDIEDMWKKLDQNSQAWKLLIDDQAKVMTVNEFIERYRKKRIRISKSPEHYAKMIDDMALQNPKLLENPFMGIVQILAVMEYDFDYGGDRDEIARKLLGPMYESNKQRLSVSH